jgi:hypothetical protein
VRIQELSEAVCSVSSDAEARVNALLLAAEALSLSEDVDCEAVTHAYKRVLEIDPQNETAQEGIERFRANAYQERARNYIFRLLGMMQHAGEGDGPAFFNFLGAQGLGEEEEEEEEEEEGEGDIGEGVEGESEEDEEEEA